MQTTFDPDFPTEALHAEWNAKHAAQADAEGWGIFNQGEIQRDDEADKFASDADAFAFVCEKARAGSECHALALRVCGFDANGKPVDTDGNPLDGSKGLRVFYICPDCGEHWESIWSCACNDECPKCGASDIEATDWESDGSCTQAALEAFNAA